MMLVLVLLVHQVVIVAINSIVNQALEQLNIFSWEDMFGVDNPDYLPYWVKYMPPNDRMIYLKQCGHTFLDFDVKMLSSNFDWKSWQNQV